MSDKNITQAFRAIEQALDKLGRTHVIEALQPGISRRYLRAALASVGLIPNRPLETLYKEKNGTSHSGGGTLGDIWMFPGFYMLSIEEAIADYQGFVPDDRWTVGWLPLFANGGGDFYVIDLGGATASRGSIRHFRIDESEHPIEFLSLGDMLVTLSVAFDREAFFVDSDGYLEMDIATFARIAFELNPHVEWWAD